MRWTICINFKTTVVTTTKILNFSLTLANSFLIISFDGYLLSRQKSMPPLRQNEAQVFTDTETHQHQYDEPDNGGGTACKNRGQ